MERREPEVQVNNADPKVTRIALTWLPEEVNAFISSWIRNEHLKALEAPDILLRDMETHLQQRARLINYLSMIAGRDTPEIVVGNRVEELLQDIPRGIMHTGAYFGGLKAEDPLYLEIMLQQITEGRLCLDHFGAEEAQRFDAYRKRLENLPHLSNKTYLAGEDLEMGVWTEVKYSQESFFNEVPLSIPLKAGRKITIEISKWNKGIFPKILVSGDKNFITTIPVLNAQFYYEGFDSSKPRIRTITCSEQHEGLSKKLGYYVANTLYAALLPELYSENYIRPKFHPKMRTKLRSLLSNEIGANGQMLERVGITDLLARIMGFVEEKSSGEDTDGLQEMDLEWLTQTYERTNWFPGTCKAHATLMAGFCASLDLPARIVAGSVMDLNSGNGGGHMWSEVFIPSIGKWVPIDPLNRTFLAYQKEDVVYFLEGAIYPTRSGNLKIKIDYCD